MSEIDTDALTEALDWLRSCHGHRLSVSRQHLANGRMEMALTTHGEALAFAQAIRMVEAVDENDGEIPGYEHRPEYAAVSDAVLAADESAREEDTPDPPSVGVQ